MENFRKKGITLLKVAISAALLYFIFTKIPFSEVLTVVKRSQPLYVFGALLFFIVSKVIAAYRLNLYFHEIGVLLTQKSNLKLYLLGMFYNLFLPGGIGGDAYKGYYVKQHFEVPTKKVVAVLLMDRLSGLLLLFVFACILGVTIEVPELLPFNWLIGLCIPLSIIIFWGIQQRFFTYILPVFWRSNVLSSFVQLAQLGCVLMILQALNIQVSTIEYLFIFLISSIVSVLPLTIGGIGSRELVFLYGALWLGLEEDRSVGISMLFFLITAFISLLGIWYHFRKPKLNIKP
ncbi:lysylphosphatidylglycerol synthase transmembrane domain-containing protein [uncultured Muriicola sp.]|uniref:lysylphosphatidylglycerol synthase transmembrane domain-containing protein n=1 Tax=uncultured Muriicola sp. TaxID=1583102 RepID=UPI0026089B53|nr:lysylphosphatidylglycerol synthase transmembrane domain-containing protein [uncultured Muriicola sp.]